MSAAPRSRWPKILDRVEAVLTDAGLDPLRDEGKHAVLGKCPICGDTPSYPLEIAAGSNRKLHILCLGGHEPPAILNALPALREITEQRTNGARPISDDPDAITAELGRLLGLDSIGVLVTGAEVFGKGPGASGNLHLSDGRIIDIERMTVFSSPAKLALLIATSVGMAPAIKMPGALQAGALVHRLAEHYVGLDRDTHAIDWGTSFLQSARTLPVDMSDQASRWQAFDLIQNTEPGLKSKSDGTSYAAQCVVPVDPAGVRYVRCSWFVTHVRLESSVVSALEISNAMARVGWSKNGTEGRIKATAPGRRATLQWAFFQIPKGWGDDA